MAQDPLKVDQLQIEPGASGNRRIRRGAGGALEFVDADTTGITPKELAGLKSVTGVIVVGKGGLGVDYTSIQQALDVVPTNASATNPYLIMILPGVYSETINIIRDGVTLLGLGAVTLKPQVAAANAAGAYHTVVVQESGTTPLTVTLRGLAITNNHDGYACIRVVGDADEDVGSNGINIIDCHFTANAPGGNKDIWATKGADVVVSGGAFASGDAETTIDDAVTLTLKNVMPGTVAATNDATVGGAKVSGTVSFDEEATSEVELPFEFSGTTYEIRLELQGNPGVYGPWITAKTSTGFTINFAAAVTLDVVWTADGRV